MSLTLRISLDARAASHTQAGGFKTYTEQLVNHLPAVDERHHYLFYVDRESYSLAASFKNVETRVLPTHLPLLGAGWREQVAIPRQVARDCVQLVHFPTNTGALYLPCPSVITLHDAFAWEEPIRIRGLGLREALKRNAMALYNRYIASAAARQACRVITVSDFSKQELVAKIGLAPDRVIVIPNAPSESYFPVLDQAARQAVLEKLGIESNFVLALSSASPRKNVFGLLDSYALLRPELRQKHRLVVVLTHSLWKERIKERIRRLELEGMVQVLNTLDEEELRILYSSAALFVFPSLREGFGLPPLEAMRCGAPVVSSNLSSMPETLGDAVIYADPRNASEFAHAMALVLESPQLQNELRTKGFGHARKFSWRSTAERVVQVYESIESEKVKNL